MVQGIRTDRSPHHTWFQISLIFVFLSFFVGLAALGIPAIKGEAPPADQGLLVISLIVFAACTVSGTLCALKYDSDVRTGAIFFIFSPTIVTALAYFGLDFG